MGIGRIDFLRSMGILPEPGVPDLTKITLDLYEKHDDEDHVSGAGDREERWHTSFHASGFVPGMNKACGRKALYGLLDIPEQDRVPGHIGLIGDVGKALEQMFVDTWNRAGILITQPPPAQTGFVDAEHWFTGYIDAALDLSAYGCDTVYPVDVKGKDHDVVNDMRKNSRDADQEHVWQVMAYMYFCRRFHQELFGDTIPHLRQAESGGVLYVSRQRPGVMCLFNVRYDEQAVEEGIQRLKTWKSMFRVDQLPDRPKEWRWTEAPCDWCNYKRGCKQDTKDTIRTLANSNLIQFAKTIRPDYDIDEVKQRVLDRWENAESGMRIGGIPSTS